MKKVSFTFLISLVIGFIVQFALSTDKYQYSHKEQVYEINYRLGKIDAKKLNVNYGGCGFLALYLSNYFDSTKVPYKINYIYRFSINGTPNHVVLQLDDNTYIDVNGFSTKTWLRIYGENFIEVSKEKLIDDLYHLEWNSKFNRNDTIILKNALK